MTNKQLAEALRAISLDALPIKDRAAVLNAAEALEISNDQTVLESMARMFNNACTSLAIINEALGLDAEDVEIGFALDAIKELQARAALDVAASKEGEA